MQHYPFQLTSKEFDIIKRERRRTECMDGKVRSLPVGARDVRSPTAGSIAIDCSRPLFALELIRLGRFAASTRHIRDRSPEKESRRSREPLREISCEPKEEIRVSVRAGLGAFVLNQRENPRDSGTARAGWALHLEKVQAPAVRKQSPASKCTIHYPPLPPSPLIYLTFSFFFAFAHNFYCLFLKGACP
jgi:hypothetical protein